MGASPLADGHPSRDIVASVNDYLAGRCIVLGVTGSVSAYRSVDVARWLMRRGATVVPVLTEPAAELVGPMLFHWATSVRPITRLTGEVEHVAMARTCDAMVVAPATLSTMSKIAHGVVDNPVALAAVSMHGAGRPVLVVPAMHGNMLESHAYREAASSLARDGYVVLPPRFEEGVAKYPEVWLVGRVAAALASRGRDLEGKRVLVTAGATREWIDPTRFISNPSTGRMGVEVAVEAWARGARVDLVYGHVSAPLPHMVNLYHADTTEEMADTVSSLSSRGYDYVVAAAAPADYRPSESFDRKLRSGIERISLDLVPTPKVIQGIAGRARVLTVFAAETVDSPEELKRAALEKMEKYYADIVVANNVSRRGAGFASPRLDAYLAWKTRGGVRGDYIGMIDKEILSRRILDLSLSVEEEKQWPGSL